MSRVVRPLVVSFHLLFLLLFTLVLFSNVTPISWLGYTKVISISVIFLSVLILSSVNSILLFISSAAFLLMTITFSLSSGMDGYEILFANSKFYIFFSLTLGVTTLFKFKSIGVILNQMGFIVVLKMLLVAIVFFNANLGGFHFKEYILDEISLVVHQLFGIYRVFDPYFYLFPLAFFFLRGTRLFVKFSLHALVLINLISSLAMGMVLPYVMAVIFITRKEIVLTFLVCFLIAFCLAMFAFYDVVVGFLDFLYQEKLESIGVKISQYIYLYDNVNLFGGGFGKSIIIFGREDTKLENIYIYWALVHGLLGAFLLLFLFIIIPTSVCFYYRGNPVFSQLFLLNLSVSLASLSNPYLESFIGILPAVFTYSYMFYLKVNAKYTQQT